MTSLFRAVAVTAGEVLIVGGDEVTRASAVIRGYVNVGVLRKSREVIPGVSNCGSG